MDIDYSGPVTAMCPSSVNGTNYIWHPQPIVDDDVNLNAYVIENRKFRSVAISDAVHSEAENPVIWFESNTAKTELHFSTPDNDLIAITEHRLIFICGPRDLVLNEAIQLYLHLHLHRLGGQTQMLTFPWTVTTPLAEQMAHTGRGLGVLSLNRLTRHLPLQGCGSSPSPLFAADTEVTVNPVNRTRSCVVDPMSKSPIGFLCEGTIVPNDCMRSLIGHNGEVVTTPEPYSYLNFQNYGTWVVTRYFNELALPQFGGECRCIDPETGAVKAKIEIRMETEYVCDIFSMVERNLATPIGGAWCSVVLHPGSTLTIKFPVEAVYWESPNEHSSTSLSLQNLPRSLLKAEFFPTDLITLRQLSTHYDVDVYERVLYHEVLAGNALELDATQMFRGEVKLKYHDNKPLALVDGLNSFYFHWAVKYRNRCAFDMIRAILNVAFAFTHQYTMVGCDREQTNVFDHDLSMAYCYTNSVGNGIGDVYECTFRLKCGRLQAGIRCGPNEELLPNNCDSLGYNLRSNKMMSFPGSIRNVTPYRMLGFQILGFEFRDDSPVSHACVCVDQRGYEMSRIILELDHQKHYTYGTNRQETSHMLLPYIWMLWPEVGLLGEGHTAPRCLMIHYVPQEPITVHVGETVLLHCGMGSVASLQYDPLIRGAVRDFLSTAWLPNRPDEFYYAVKKIAGDDGLLRMRYKDSIATTPGGFRIMSDETYLTEYVSLKIESRGGTILISKDPVHKQHVPMTFVCAKAPKQTDVSSVAGNASTSETPVLPNFQTIRSPTRYTWDVVQVKVETTDPYMQGCGVTYESDEFFKPETPKLYDGDGNLQFGCKIDFQTAKEAAFYCPAPYVLDPPNCFSQTLVDGSITNMADVSKSLRASRSNHFVILQFDDSLVGPGETLRQTPPLECRCVTVKGVVLSTIQIENYYSK
ncbi:hypothetical protein, conserved [Babesia ovata]|uniref:6-Cys domain-containing protein n=1 Tax=Babesia ovata TaxID=189622 RepID=A0A2H6K8A0_9APIC|nr:uncharacterized protein BOVATA_006720 [Babesia ovata]GBE59179.1 hypothetical protein, conserved [Babesia ovata]